MKLTLRETHIGVCTLHQPRRRGGPILFQLRQGPRRRNHHPVPVRDQPGLLCQVTPAQTGGSR